MTSRLSRSAVVVAVGATVLAGTAVSASAEPAFVEKSRGEGTCQTDPGDVPGLAPFVFANSTVTVTSAGVVNVTCFGSLPEGVSLPSTYVGSLICRGDTPEQDVTGRITITRSGRAVLHCQFRS